jgi:hypothetical protein
VLSLLRQHQSWLTTTVKGAEAAEVQPLDVKPILVLTGEPDAQQTVFYDQVQTGDRVLLFGAIHTEDKDPSVAPEAMDPGNATNYRRWWNNPWKVVEAGGQPDAGEWTAAKMNRLRALVERAHANGLWIRFYTLDGATKAQLSCNGWFHDYNFGSLDKARVRWRAAIAAHVDYLASDQYEQVAQEIRHTVTSKGK